jgi:hypothetical protein
MKMLTKLTMKNCKNKSYTESPTRISPHHDAYDVVVSLVGKVTAFLIQSLKKKNAVHREIRY